MLFPFRLSRLVKPEPPATCFDPTDTPVPDLVEAYEDVVHDLLHKVGLTEVHVYASVRRVGTCADGLPTFAVFLRVVSWTEKSLKLMLGLPLIEKAVNRALARSWVLEASHFGGVWLHTAPDLKVPSVLMSDVRTLLDTLHYAATAPRQAAPVH